MKNATSLGIYLSHNVLLCIDKVMPHWGGSFFKTFFWWYYRVQLWKESLCIFPVGGRMGGNGTSRPFFSIKDVNFLWEIYSQVISNLLFGVLIGTFKSDVKFLISCQTLKLRSNINVWRKNQISERKIKLCWINLI